MTTAEDILSFIEANPDDDVARLVYAEALDYDGYSPRAELIRLQCDRENPFDCTESTPSGIAGGVRAGCPRCIRLTRESELLTQHAAEFRRGPQCGACDGKKGKPLGETSWIDCRDCRSTGDVGGLMRRTMKDNADDKGGHEDWLHDVEWHRGFPRVFCRMEECVRECPSCDSHGYVRPAGEDEPCLRCGGTHALPTDWLLSVVRHHRGVEVWVSEYPPVLHAIGKWGWTTVDIMSLPLGIRELIEPDTYNSSLEAQVALARAIPAWARGHLVGTAA